MKVVITGCADDSLDWKRRIRRKDNHCKLRNQLKGAKDPFRFVIVRDMRPAGFGSPYLRSMNADKPMQGHGLMQANARVVYRYEPGVLVVNYAGLAP